MFRQLSKYYAKFLIFSIVKVILVFASSLFLCLCLEPFKIPFFLGKVFASLFLAIYLLYTIQRLHPYNFIWALEKNNPTLRERLISLYELRHTDSPFKTILASKVREILKSDLKIQIPVFVEFRLFYSSLILLLTLLLVMPAKYSHLDQIPLAEITPRVVIASPDSVIVFQTPFKQKFFIQQEGMLEQLCGKGYKVSIKFEKEGKYRILGKGSRKTLPAVAKIIESPVIDSFQIRTPHKTMTNPQWIAITAGTPLRVIVYVKRKFNIRLLSPGLPLKRSDEVCEFSLTPMADVCISAELSNGLLKKNIYLATISVVPNLPPEIEIYEPVSIYSYVPENMQTIIKGRTFDEDGVKVIYLHYALRGVYRRLKLPGEGQREKTFQFSIDLQKASMLPGDELKFYVLAEDEQGLIDSSEVYTVIFPTLEEIYREETKRVSELMSQFSRGTETFSAIAEKIYETVDSMRLNPGNFEAREKDVQKVVEGIQNLIKEFSSITENFELLRSVSISPELMQKLQKVGEELYTIMERELPDLLKKLEDARDSLGGFKKQNFEELEKGAQELMEKLTFLEQILEMARKEIMYKEMEEKLKQLVEKRQTIKNLTDEESMNLIKEMEEKFGIELEQTLNDFRDNFRQLEIADSMMKEISSIRELQQRILKSAAFGNRKQTSKLQESQTEELKGMLSHLKTLKETEMRQDLSRLLEIIVSIRRALILTSLELEENLSQKGFITYVYRSLERTRIEMKKAGVLLLMTSSRAPKLIDMAMDSLFEKPSVSLKYINSAIFELFRIQAAAKSSSQSNGMEAMKFLENLMKMQASMIRETGAQMQIPIPMPSNFQGSMLDKLSEMKSQLISMYMNAQNQEVREKIEQALKELEKTQEKLKKRELDSELIENQRKTLKHLLEAYGVYKREEFTQKRYAEPAKEYHFTPPAPKGLIDEGKLLENINLLNKMPSERQKILRKFYYDLLRL